MADGKIAVDGYEQIAHLMGVPGPSFMSTYQADVDQMKQNILDYMTGLQNLKKNPHLAFTVNRATEKKPIFTLRKTLDSFPILPIPLQDKNWTKADWEEAFSLYVNYHYQLGTGGISDKVPYTDISNAQATFIDPKYLPHNMKFTNPRNLHKEDIQAFFSHLRKDGLGATKYPDEVEADLG
ncbi:hypothetical protein CVT25_008018 [Psilocybe cyanescens]|uniref:Uncharacterized protein n=1 Tax=Psilocybe cyanescens TaxID=93625 RepID=A0A409XTU3_PSICY|nr:hypothetical protein CVT25_008018 [Psilocybe cyanescens]